MANGQQKAQDNLSNFVTWVSTMSDDDFRQIIHRGKLNRAELAKAVGCGKSAFNQNPALKKALGDLESRLRKSKVLPPLVETMSQSAPKEYEVSSRQNVLLIKKNSELERQNIELKAKLKEMEKKLERFGELNETLAEMGFMQR